MTQRDYRLEGCLRFVFDPVVSAVAIESAGVGEIVEAYRRNMERVKSAFFLPIWAAEFSARRQRASDAAVLAVRGALEDVGEFASDKAAILAALKTELQANADAMSGEMAPIAAEEFVKRGIVLVTSIIRPSYDDPVANGLDQMFYTQIVSSWTAFETLAADLWEEALNQQPQILAALSGSAANRYITGRPIQEGAEQGRRAERGGKSVGLHWLQRYHYDIGDKMGTIHRRTFAFDRLSGIREAYAAAFSRDFAELDHHLGDEAIDAVSHVRNAIVHRAGVADKEYDERTQAIAAPRAAVGQPIQFNGDSLSALLEPFISSARGLITAVDNWLVRNR